MNTKSAAFIAQSAAIAALYVAVTLAVAPISFGPIQFRVSEALAILPLFSPSAIVGLTAGCAIANGAGVVLGLTTPYDIVFGPAATLLAAVFTYLLKNIKIKNVPIFAPLPPVVFNALIIGAYLAAITESASKFVFFYYALTVAVGEIAACYGLGLPLYIAVKKTGFDKYLKS